MRHQNHKFNIGGSRANRAEIVRNLACEIIDHGKILTTHPKCKAVQSFVEKLITLAKKDSIANRRLAVKKLHNEKMVYKLFTEVAPKFKERNGGYTRIIKKAEGRVGDNAPVSYIALVD